MRSGAGCHCPYAPRRGFRVYAHRRTAEAHEGFPVETPPKSQASRQEVGVILFLDFDGVLHPETGKMPFENTHLLWQILRKAPDVRVVFSTSWRESYSFDELVNFATFGGGESLSHLFVGVTPVVPVAQGADDYGDV